MHPVPSTSRCAALVLAALLGGCGDDPPPGASGSQARPLQSDPAITQSWNIPAGKSPLAGGDLGASAPALAEALMTTAKVPGISHRITMKCAEQGSLKGMGSIALRFSIDDAGKLTDLHGDPKGEAATCLGDGLTAELATITGLPAGAALLVLRFTSAAPGS